MLKQLLTGTAVAALLVAGPVAAQTTIEQPQDTQQMQESPDTELEAGTDTGMDTDSESDIGADTAQDMESETETDTLAQDPALESETDTESLAEDPSLESETDTDTLADDPSAAPEGDPLAQDLDTESETDVTAAEPMETYFTEQQESEILASELMGANVENPEGENLGSINDVIVDEETGIKAVVIGVGGFLGLGQKNVAVNFAEIEHVRDMDSGEVTLVFSATEDQLAEAPEFRNLEQMTAEAEQDTQMQQPAGGGGAPMGGAPAGGGGAPMGGAPAPAD